MLHGRGCDGGGGVLAARRWQCRGAALQCRSSDLGAKGGAAMLSGGYRMLEVVWDRRLCPHPHCNS